MRLHATHEPEQADQYERSGGPWDVPSIDELLLASTAEDRIVLIDETERLGGAAVNRRVAGLAGGLVAAGVAHGDVVAWQLPNCVMAVLLSRACWRIGAIPAPLHHRAGQSELATMIEMLEPTVSIASAELPLSDLEGVVALGDDRSAGILAGPPVWDPTAAPEDLALVQFTSGSTGVAKAVLHTHRSLTAKALQMIESHGLGAGDATLVPAPISHISGMLNGVLVPGVAGMRVVLMNRWDPTRGLELIRDEAVSFMIGPPTIFTSLMEAPNFSPDAVSSLRIVSCGGTGITPEFVVEAADTLGALVKRSYGCTEAPTVTTSALDDPPDRAAWTDGRPMGATEIRIADPVTHEDRDVGDVGEVWVRGPELFAGYALAEQTADAMVDGWFRTGDLARMDSDGWLTLVGRSKDLIIRGGENIAPAEVERVLELHPLVRQAVVVGVPDDRLGERVVAFVVGDGDLDVAACTQWFVDQGVARFKAPEVVVQVHELPLLSLGKPDRDALRDRAQALAT